jgi:hypothetical protein
MENKIEIVKITKIEGKRGRRPLKEGLRKNPKDYPVSVETRKKYNDLFAEKHKGETFDCEVCLTTHSIFNKSYHKRSKKHQMAINIRKSYELPSDAETEEKLMNDKK